MLSEGPDNANKRMKKDIFQSTFSPLKRWIEAGWTISRSRVNLPCHLILAVSVERRFSAVWEDHLKQCH